MTDKETRILEAALATCSRYGVRRATMGDVARAAGMSRQTLYATYPNKDELFVAVVQHVCRKSLAEIRDEWTRIESIEAKLDAYFEIAVVAIFDMLHNTPDAQDLISGTNTATRNAVLTAEAMKVDALVEIFRARESDIMRTGQTLEQFARFVQITAENFKYSAVDRAELSRLLASLKIAVMAIIA